MEALEPRYVMTGDLVISEFMAANDGTLVDNYGAESDWIEVHNQTAAPINLNGYYLTDDHDDLTKWQFPNVSIGANGYLLVYASGQDDRDPLQPLHTNFALASEGEYLGLIAPNGSTIVHEFAPEYPEQKENVSYGAGQIVSEVQFVAPGASAKSIVTTAGNHATYDPVWNLPSYTPDANWISGTTGVGFGQTFDGFLVREYQANVSAGSPIGTTLDSIDEVLALIDNPVAYTSVVAGNYATINFRNNYSGAGNATRYTTGQIEFPGQNSGTDYSHVATEVHAQITIPSAGDWTFGLDHNEGYLLRIDDQEFEQSGTGSTERFHTFTFDAPGTYDLDLYHFERTGSSWLKLYAAPGVFTTFNAAAFDLVGDTANGGLAVKSDVVGGNGTSIGQLVGTNLQTQMLSVNSTFYTRIPFNVSDPAAFDQLKLRMKYDDAFVAYLNGQEVAKRNVSGTPVWNSVAQNSRGDQALTYEDIDISAFLSALVAGPNLLAIHGINFAASNPDALVMPELIATDALTSESLGYFVTPTPGAANSTAYLGLVADTQFSVDRGFYDTPFQVEITTVTPGAQIYYTTNGESPTQSTGVLYAGPVTIDKTTTLRAAAFLAGYLPTNVDTETYLFLDDVVQQTYAKTVAQGFPTSWGTSVPNANFPAGNLADAMYGLDPDIVGNFDANGNPTGGDLYGGVYAAQLKDALLSIPTMSIVMDMDDLFSANAGIITNASARGVAWERATSIEWITSNGEPEFQVDAGIRIQGAFFRSNTNNLKKSFRILFKDIYGPGKLSFPLFDGAVDSFNTLVLRGGGNDGYSWNSAKLTEQFTRDQFMRDLQLASGNVAPHGNFVHLYINGVYWGLYNPVERPDNEFAASYFGGTADNIDVVHRGGGSWEVQNGNDVAWLAMLDLAAQAGSSQTAYMQLQGKNLDGTPNLATPPLLDVTSYIDYIVVNTWGGNWDWPRNNFWAARDRDPLTTTGFHFFNWDGENTMGNNRSRSPLTADDFNPATTPGNDWGQDGTSVPTDNAGRPHILLSNNPEYRMQFADRAYRLLFNDGILTPNKLIERYQALTDEVELAIIGESARWGDMQAHRSPSPNRALTPADWENERAWIIGQPNTRGGDPYLPNRSAVFLNQLIQYGLFPSTVAPTFSQHGGQVVPGFDLTISAPAGTVWYTLDGSDPRPYGGGTSPSGTAIQYTGSPVDIPSGLTVRARALVGSEWSPLNEATFVTAVPADATNLKVSEIHYNPAAHVGVTDPQDLEFVELTNVGVETLTLNGVKVGGFANTPYTFENGLTLAPGARIVLAKSPAVFQSVYGSSVNLAPSGYGMDNLSNGGELVTLIGPLGDTLLSFTYDDVAPWPTAPDGGGPSLEIINPLGNPSSGANWRASHYVGGSPGGSGIVGDYDGNGVVQQADQTVWQAHYGTAISPGLLADGNGDGIIDTADYVVWRKQLASGAAAASSMTAENRAPAVATNESTSPTNVESRDLAIAAFFASFNLSSDAAGWLGHRPRNSQRIWGDAPATPWNADALAIRELLAGHVAAVGVKDTDERYDPAHAVGNDVAWDSLFGDSDDDLAQQLTTL